MQISPLPFEYVASLAPVEVKDGNRINIFQNFGTAGCLLDCAVGDSKQELLLQHTTKKGEKRAKTKSLKEFERNNRKLHQETHGPAEPGTGLPAGDRARWRPEFTWEGLELSVASGCGSCGFIHLLLDGFFSLRTDLLRGSLTLQWLGHAFCLKATERSGANQSHFFQFFNPLGSSNFIQGMPPPANVLRGDTSSDMSLTRARKWIQECENCHKHCGLGREVALPKRLVDLGAAGEDYKQVLRLTETEGVVGTYVCLSHCWGKDPMPIRTLEENIKDHFQSLPWKLLPNTFRDAIEVTSRLGIRYVWIDSLCIIQNSALDWQVESSKMADIYHNSYVTLAAVSSADFRGGCFSSNKTGDMCFSIQEQGGRSIIVAVRDDKGMGQITKEDDVTKAFPLLTRAWVYQERLLSRRVLYFNYGELQLECREAMVCECSSRSIAPHPLLCTPASQLFAHEKSKYAKALKNHMSTTSTVLHCKHWQRTVCQYSKLQLTHAGDKLPALSGCTKDTARFWKDDYLAGLWRKTLAEGLLWSVIHPIYSPRPAVWRAPSWSWANVDTPYGVDYSYPRVSRFRQRFQQKIEEAYCEPAGADTTGAVSTGFIRLRTSLCPVYLRRLCHDCAKSRTNFSIETDAWYAISRRADWASCQFGVQPLVLDAYLYERKQRFHPDFKPDEVKDFGIDAENSGGCRLGHVFLLHLYDGASVGHRVVEDYFLVVRKVIGQKMAGRGNLLERIGLFVITFENWDKRDEWFATVYTPQSTKETVLTLV
ncbi:heterokaryon incompatibility protein-domain-containing protein [Cladorrhinum sp. PSN259]|nr:heterokaryon incompatibility protein-domain-containing protein [Cladorrhinum sp. PSN259]